MTEQIPEDFDPFAGPTILATAPTTDPQREIWTASVLGEETSLAYNESITLVFRGKLDVDALKASLADVVARHEALRATFTEDGLTLCVNEPALPPLEYFDFEALAEEEQQARLASLRKRAVETPFPLTLGPLFRAELVRLSEELHQLLFTAHHLVCDGWSTAVIVKDLAAFYNARSKGFEAALPNPNSFTAFARAQAERTPSERDRDEAYWLAQFQGEIPVLDLPTDRPRPPHRAYASLREDLELDAELVASLRKAGAKQRASLFATLLAGFNVLLHRLSGAEDVVVGMPSAGQASADQPTLVGHCVNMLPIRTALSGDEPFADVLGRVRTGLLDAQEHQDFTFGALLQKLPIARDPSRTPLVTVIFNVDRGLTGEAIGFDDLQVELLTNPRHFENFELFVNAVELGGTVTLECQYNTGLFSADTIRRWLLGYRELLRSVANDPSQKVGALRILTREEEQKLAAWNETKQVCPEGCVYEWVAAQAARRPNAAAVEFENQVLTYAELDARSNQLARRLRQLGVNNQSLVGLCLERTPELFVGLLGIHKAGAGYVPLDPDYPADRLRFMVEDAALSVLITSKKLAHELPLPAPATIILDQERAALDQLDASALARDADSAQPESVAYVIYTSGSTGQPKGVLVPQRAFANLVNSVARCPGLTEHDVVLGITTLSFDIAVSETWLPLSVGAKIALVSRETAADGASLDRVLREKQVTFIDATPATYRLLLNAGWKGSPNALAICTGEAMPKDLALQLLPMVRELWNGYGPTETCVWSTFWRVPEGFDRVLIGRPVDNTEIHVLDAQGGQVPPGVVGELFIAGLGVALGYLRRPELSRERFVPNPFVPGTLMYKTGDLGRYLEGGVLECLGRNDHQIKLRGFRIELGEIEDALRQHPEVGEAAVILREDNPGDPRIVGYFTHPGKEPDTASLRQHLKRTLPDYMVPYAFCALASMPLTPSGKINRKALPKPDTTAPAATGEFIEPRSATEHMLAVLWAEALKLGRVSVEDDFFALGGHSLLAAQIMGRLRRDHSVELSFRNFFESPTIAKLAARIDESRGRISQAPTRKPIARREAGVEVPLSVSQERLFLLEEMHPAQRIVHNLPAAWRLEGNVDLTLLQRSLDTLVARHEAFRTTVGFVGKQPVQRISAEVQLPIDLVDLSEVPSAERHARMMQRIRQLSAEPFDLEKGPLFLSVLFHLEPGISVYFTLRHNLIWDGWSFDVFVNELCLAYTAFSRGQEPELPPLLVSYADYTLWHREWLKSSAMAEQIAWWQGKLKDAPSDLALPLDRPRPAQANYAGDNLFVEISREQADVLTRLGRDAGTTLYNVLFAAYSILLQRYSGEAEVLVGTPVRARVLPEVETLIGPFINAVILRTPVDPEQSFAEHLNRVREITLDAFSHEEMPLELLGIRPPVVRAFFSFQDARSRAISLGDVRVVQVDVEPPAAANDLMVWIMERPHGLTAVANFSSEIFDRETIRQLLESYQALLSDIAENPKKKLSELSLQPAEKTAPEEVAPPEAGTQLPAAHGLAHELVLEFCKSASIPALIVGERSFTGSELSRRAAAIAHKVGEMGLDIGSTVGLRSPRSFELYAAVLGLWQAGLAPLVLDPSVNAKRALRSLEACKATLLLTNVDDNEGFVGGELQVLDIGSIGDESARGLGRRVTPEAPAWVAVTMDEAGVPSVSRQSHASLVACVDSLARTLALEPGSRLAVVAAPGSEYLPLELLLGPRSGVTTLFAQGSVHTEDALAECARGSEKIAGFGPSDAWPVCLGEGAKMSTSVVYEGGSRAFYRNLLAASDQVFAVRRLPDPVQSLLVQRITDPFDGDLLGTPLGDLTVSVVDARGRRVPVGAVGRIRVESPGRPPVILRQLARQARGTARLLEAGGNSVLRHGQRFLPAEVARCLEAHPSVQRALVRAEEATPGDWQLVAYFEPKAGTLFTETELRAHLRATLPEALVPRVYVEVQRFATLADGSLDLSQLRSPLVSAGAEYVEPSSDNEKLLAELFQKALRVGRVGRDDKFFDLGGHSLLCFQVLNELEQASGYRMSPRVLLLNTLAQAAAELDRHTTLGSGAPPAPALNREVEAARSSEEKLGLRGKVLHKLTGFLRR